MSDGAVRAVVALGGRQRSLVPSQLLQVDLLDAEPGAQVSFDQVLMLCEGEKVQFGTPYLEGVSVKAQVVRRLRGPKVRIIKSRRRQNSRNRMGFRAELTEVRVLEILEGKRSLAKAGDVAQPKAKAAPKKAAAPAKGAKTSKKAAAPAKAPAKEAAPAKEEAEAAVKAAPQKAEEKQATKKAAAKPAAKKAAAKPEAKKAKPAAEAKEAKETKAAKKPAAKAKAQAKPAAKKPAAKKAKPAASKAAKTAKKDAE